MFSNWKVEKATAGRVEEALALSEKLAAAKPHVVDSHAATARFWAQFHLSSGSNLYDLSTWKPTEVVKFVKTAESKVAVLRKQREYSSSDGLSIWLHTARAVIEPRIAPAVREIWHLLAQAGPNAQSMAEEMLQEAGLAVDHDRKVPRGFEAEGQDP